MPYPIIPPPVSDTGAWTVPRQLQRWLDTNPVTKLTKTQGYITLPAFSVAYTWNGYSDIVASFNFEGPNNFSLSRFQQVLPVSPNYLLAISYRVGNSVTRYFLWQNVGEVLYFPTTLYTGQFIKKNFRFEIWSTTQGSPAVNGLAINFYTTVLGKVDYRWGNDFTLVSDDGLQVKFGEQGIATIALPTTDCIFALNGNLMLNINTWTDIANGLVFTNYPGGGGAVVTGSPFNYGINIESSYTFANATLAHVFILAAISTAHATPSTSTTAFRTIGGASSIGLQNSTQGIHASATTGAVTNAYTPDINTFYLIELQLNNSGLNNQINVYDPNTLTLLGTNYAASSGALTGVTVVIVSDSVKSAVAFCAAYSSIQSGTDLTTILNYVQQLAQGLEFSIPITFPAGSYSQLN